MKGSMYQGSLMYLHAAFALKSLFKESAKLKRHELDRTWQPREVNHFCAIIKSTLNVRCTGHPVSR